MNKNIVILFTILFLSIETLSHEILEHNNEIVISGDNINFDYIGFPPGYNKQSQFKTEVNSSHYTEENIDGASNNAKDVIDVDLSNLTWTAYDHNGDIVRSGRVSGGKDYCPDTNSNCETVTGTFTILRKGDEDCKSTIFPVGKGGAPMPYCMFFHEGFALHGSNSVPDYNASHGCVRMSHEDAQWLNEDFVQVGLTKVYTHY